MAETCLLVCGLICFYFQFNFVGRILGPRGLTAKQLEQETGCKVMVRGKGSMRDKKKVSHLSSLFYLQQSRHRGQFNQRDRIEGGI